jgi:hypothetical protein
VGSLHRRLSQLIFIRRAAKAKRKANQAKEATLKAQAKPKKRKAPEGKPEVSTNPDYLPEHLLQAAAEAFEKDKEERRAVKEVKKPKKKIHEDELPEGASVQLP